MKIVHFCGALMGGPLSAIAEWTRQQAAAGHEIALIYSPLRDPLDSFRGALPPDIALIPLDVGREINPRGDIAAARKLAAWLKQAKPDILHLHSSKAGAIGRVAAWLAGVPAIYSTHSIAFLRTDVGLPTRMLFFAMEWLLGLIGTATVACSPSELKAIRLIPGRKLVIPNGIDMAAMPAPRMTDDHPGLEIVLCGRITMQKSPSLACAIADASPPAWRWTWLGGGDLEEMVRRRGRIAVAGWLPRSEVLARMGGADVMVHTSSWEGMPIAMLEAMALGLPVVATDVVGNRDLVRPGETGYVARDVEEFLKALQKLAETPALRRKMGDAARAAVIQEYDQDQLAKRWQALYGEVYRR